MQPFVSWISRAHSEQDGTPSTKRLLFSATIFASIALLVYDVIAHKGFRSESITALTVLVGATAGAYGVTQFAK